MLKEGKDTLKKHERSELYLYQSKIYHDMGDVKTSVNFLLKMKS
jgi:hypothetical protein